MKLRPPKRFVSKNAGHFQRYYGRVSSIQEGILCMTIWEWFGDRKGFGRELFSHVVMNNSQITLNGKFSCGTPVEIWTWKEKNKERAHVASMD